MTGNDAGDPAGYADALNPHLIALLRTLLAEQMAGKPFSSLPKLCKRLDLRMSTLQRLLTQLEGVDIVLFGSNASGAPTVGLTESGRALAAAVAPAAPA